MKSSLVITLLGDDRPGLVNMLSDLMVTHNANWADSQMANMLGKFAGILHVHVSPENIEGLTQSLQNLHNEDNQLRVLVDVISGHTHDTDSRVFDIELTGQDRPGIIDEITSVLANLDVNVEHMATEQREASMSNEIYFFAHLSLRLPASSDIDAVQDALEELSDQLMVDIDFE